LNKFLSAFLLAAWLINPRGWAERGALENREIILLTITPQYKQEGQ
jgi:hypothetical protein